MTSSIRPGIPFVLTALLAVSSSFAATMSKSDYSTAKSQIDSVYKTDRAACDSSTANAKDICVEKAKGKEKVAKAELEYGYSGKAKDAKRLAVVKSDTAYAVAKEMCDDKTGNDKGICVKEAKAIHTSSLADARMTGKVTDARKEATDDKRDAEYKLATEKCDSLTGNAKDACIGQAKVKYGKS